MYVNALEHALSMCILWSLSSSPITTRPGLPPTLIKIYNIVRLRRCSTRWRPGRRWSCSGRVGPTSTSARWTSSRWSGTWRSRRSHRQTRKPLTRVRRITLHSRLFTWNLYMRFSNWNSRMRFCTWNLHYDLHCKSDFLMRFQQNITCTSHTFAWELHGSNQLIWVLSFGLLYLHWIN